MAVYTQVSEDELSAFLSNYNIGQALSFSGITEGVENSNYRLKTTTGDFILTLYEKRVNVDDLPFFMNLMAHMARHGVTCPEPVADQNGTVLKTLNGRAAAIVTFLDGTSNNTPSTQRCRSAGHALAIMHVAGGDFDGKRGNALDHTAWADLLASCGDAGEALKTGITAMAATRLQDILDNWPEDLPRGVCHADLFPDNVLFTGDDVTGIIDFYFACTDQLVYDIAITLNAWCFEADVNFNITKAKAILEGYQTVRPLSEAEIQALPILSRGAALRFLLTRLHDWFNHDPEALVRPKNPTDYLRRLRFHKTATRPQDYGITQEKI